MGNPKNEMEVKVVVVVVSKAGEKRRQMGDSVIIFQGW